MRQWTISAIVITWLALHIEAQCPAKSEISCTGVNNCYMIYPKNGDWYYKKPDGKTEKIGGSPPSTANTYIYIRVPTQARSSTDIERECQNSGANIAIINNNQEYEQLTENMVDILSNYDERTFYVKVQSLPQKKIYDKCGKITVEDSFWGSDIDIASSECTQQKTVNSIVCESTNFADFPCPGSTTITPTKKRATTSTTASSITTTSTSSTSVTTRHSTTDAAQESTNGTTQTEQTSFAPSVFKPLNRPRQASPFSNMMVFTLSPVLLVAFFIVIGLTCFVISRRRKKRRNIHSVSDAIGTDGNEVMEKEYNIYVCTDKVQCQASFDVARDTVEVHVDSIYENANHHATSQDENGDLSTDGHYTFPQNNVHEYMSYQCGGNGSENDSKLNQQTDGVSTPSEHYDIPMLSVNGNTNTYQKPSPLEGGALIQSGQYDTPNLRANEYTGSENSNMFKSSGIQYDTPKLSVNENGDNENIYQEPTPVVDGALSSSDQKCDTPMCAKSSEYGTGGKDNIHQEHIKPGGSAMKPSKHDGIQKSVKTSKKNRNKSSKHQLSQHTDDAPSCNHYDIPLRYESRDNHMEEYQALNPQETGVMSSNEPDMQKGANEYENCGSSGMDKHQEQKQPIEHYDIPKGTGTNEYENCSDSISKYKEQKRRRGGPLSSEEHYDIPREANEYEICGDSKDKHEQNGKPEGQLSSNYDIPRVANEYEICGNSVDKHQKQQGTVAQSSGDLYETVGSVNESLSYQGNSKRKNQRLGKKKASARHQGTQEVTNNYMSYEGELHNDDHYQKLDKTSIKRINLH